MQTVCVFSWKLTRQWRLQTRKHWAIKYRPHDTHYATRVTSDLHIMIGFFFFLKFIYAFSLGLVDPRAYIPAMSSALQAHDGTTLICSVPFRNRRLNLDVNVIKLLALYEVWLMRVLLGSEFRKLSINRFLRKINEFPFPIPHDRAPALFNSSLSINVPCRSEISDTPRQHRWAHSNLDS